LHFALLNFHSFFNPIFIQQGLLRENGFLSINVSLTHKITGLGSKGHYTIPPAGIKALNSDVF
jgi:hypothetical protein